MSETMMSETMREILAREAAEAEEIAEAEERGDILPAPGQRPDVLRLTPREVIQLEQALDAAGE